MFERFTEAVIHSVLCAQIESRLLWHNYIGDETLLLGLISHGKGIADQALATAGIDLPTAREEVAKIDSSKSDIVSSIIEGTPMPFTRGLEQTLKNSLAVVEALGDNNVDTEHLLLALIDSEDNEAVKVLNRMIVDKNVLRETAIKLRQHKHDRKTQDEAD